MNRVQVESEVLDVREVAVGIHVLRLRCPQIAERALPGQFVSVKALDHGWGPLLRRPFSVSRVEGETIELLFNVIGPGTKIMATRRSGDILSLLGPLGKPFTLDGGFRSALLVGGGLGVAPFPLLTDKLKRKGVEVSTFLGARTRSQVTVRSLENIAISTDDGTEGFHGNVVELFRASTRSSPPNNAKVFGCGPTRMLMALAQAAHDLRIPCEISLEGDMACGIGLCQGCPVEHRSGPRKYALVCTDGPTFDSEDVVLT